MTDKEAKHIQDHLYREDMSARARYAHLVVGTSRWGPLLKYEILTMLLGPRSGALGLLLRKWFYPSLFASVGRNVVFGRSVVVRNAQNIELGDHVMLDDLSLIDGRGAGP